MTASRPGEVHAPDLVQPVIGYRLWRLGDDGLFSPYVEERWERGVQTAVFPLYLLATDYWRSGRASRALVSDARRALAMAREESTLAGHVIHRLLRVGLNW